MASIQANMTNEEKLEFRTNNPLPCFCENSYYNFFNTWCKLYGTRCNSEKCKTCKLYKATLENK